MTRTKSNSPASSRGRFSLQRKTDAVMRVLRGELIDIVSREFGVSASTLSQWRDEFIEGGKQNLKSRGPDSAEAQESKFRNIIADQAVDLEILRRALKKVGADFPQGTSTIFRKG